MTAIRDAILANDADALRRSVDASTVNCIDADGYTPLYFACMKVSVTVATIIALVEAGATVDAKGTDGETPLYIAVFHRRGAVAQLLQQKGANVNMKNGSRQETALHLAARLGYGDVVAWLIRVKADLNVKNAKQETPLYAAAKAGRHEAAYLLLEAGADATVTNEDGKDPLFIASEKGFKHVVIVMKASPQDRKHAKAEADLELAQHPAPVMSSSEILARAETDKAFSERMRRHSTAESPLHANPSTQAPMEVVDIVVPRPKVRTHDPFTGEAVGPCRTLDEVGYEEAPPIPKELQNRPPAQLPRVGGTTMVVGTGTEEGGRKPIRVDELGGEPEVEYYVRPPK